MRRTLRLAVRCPACGAPPPEIPTEAGVRIAGAADPEVPLFWTQCRHRACGRRYPVTARAFVEAKSVAAERSAA